eukprot:1159399-Pelagomonas_calceolata.AAC.3
MHPEKSRGGEGQGRSGEGMARGGLGRGMQRKVWGRVMQRKAWGRGRPVDNWQERTSRRKGCDVAVTSLEFKWPRAELCKCWPTGAKCRAKKAAQTAEFAGMLLERN